MKTKKFFTFVKKRNREKRYLGDINLRKASAEDKLNYALYWFEHYEINEISRIMENLIFISEIFMRRYDEGRIITYLSEMEEAIKAHDFDDAIDQIKNIERYYDWVLRIVIENAEKELSINSKKAEENDFKSLTWYIRVLSFRTYYYQFPKDIEEIFLKLEKVILTNLERYKKELNNSKLEEIERKIKY